MLTIEKIGVILHVEQKRVLKLFRDHVDMAYMITPQAKSLWGFLYILLLAGYELCGVQQDAACNSLRY